MASQPDNRCCPTDKGPATCAYNPTGDDFYVVGPLSSKAGIVVVSDIFGMLPNSKRLADVLAGQGYLVVMPDFFGAKAWSEAEWPPDFASERWGNYAKFLSNMDNFMPRMDRALALLRQMGCDKVGAIGMCWGAALPFKAAAEGRVDAVVTAHPSLFKADVVKSTKTPLLVMPSMDETNMEPVEAAVNAHPVEPHVYRLFGTLPHGFLGSRFDPDTYTPEEQKDVEEACQMTIDFFQKTLH